VQLAAKSRQPRLARPGRQVRYDDEYVRHGVAEVLLTCEPLQGRRQVRVTARRTQRDWAHLIKQLVDQDYPEAERIVLVLDTLNTHTPGSLDATSAPTAARRLTDKLELDSTPVHGSLLNSAEVELSILTRQCLSRRIPDQPTLEREVAAWHAERNARPSSVDGGSPPPTPGSSSSTFAPRFSRDGPLAHLVLRQALYRTQNGGRGPQTTTAVSAQMTWKRH
jgi:hypothetical protein